MGNESRRNAEGYYDPTACEAIEEADKSTIEDIKDGKRMKGALQSVRGIFFEAGFDLIGRIKLRNRRTGKKYE